MQAEPTKEQIAEMAARGWTWEEGWKAFHPSERALIESARVWLVRGGWGGNVAFFSELEGPVSLEHAAGWAEDNLRRAALRSPIFSGLVEARWERIASRLWMLYLGTCPVVAVWEEASKFTFSVYGMGRYAATWEEVKTWVARFGLPPLPADAWEGE